MDTQNNDNQGLEYLPQEKKSGGSKIKIFIYILSIVLIGLLGLLYWLSEKKEALEKEQEQLKIELLGLQEEFDSLQTDNMQLEGQILASRDTLSMLLERYKRFRVNSFAEVKRYKDQIETMRNLMRSYVVQIDSLNTQNQALRAENKEAQDSIRSVNAQRERLEKTNELLADKLKTAAQLSLRDLVVHGTRGNGRKVTKASRVEKLLISFVLDKNSTALRGEKTIYARITNEDGTVLVTSEDNTMELEGGVKALFSVSRDVVYEGEPLPVIIYYNLKKDELKPGIYDIALFSEQAKLGEYLLRLK